jgi:hypothetical protein
LKRYAFRATGKSGGVKVKMEGEVTAESILHADAEVRNMTRRELNFEPDRVSYREKRVRRR